MPYPPWKYFFSGQKLYPASYIKKSNGISPWNFYGQAYQKNGPYHMAHIIWIILFDSFQYFKKVIHLSGMKFATKLTEFILTVTLNRWLTVMTRSMFRVTRIIQGGLLRVNTESYWQYSFYLKRALIERKQGVTCQYTSRHCHFTSVSERRTRTFGHII